ncbi:hypothetical protein ES705_24819 [subsurface metagenome]
MAPSKIKRINRSEADRLRKESTGYSTDLTCKDAIEIAWRKIDRNIKKIKFRYHNGRGEFSWSGWYEIVDK